MGIFTHHQVAIFVVGSSQPRTMIGQDWLVGGLEHVLFFHMLGMSSSQLTNSIIFQRGRYTMVYHQPIEVDLRMRCIPWAWRPWNTALWHRHFRRMPPIGIWLRNWTRRASVIFVPYVSNMFAATLMFARTKVVERSLISICLCR